MMIAFIMIKLRNIQLNIIDNVYLKLKNAKLQNYLTNKITFIIIEMMKIIYVKQIIAKHIILISTNINMIKMHIIVLNIAKQFGILI